MCPSVDYLPEAKRNIMVQERNTNYEYFQWNSEKKCEKKGGLKIFFFFFIQLPKRLLADVKAVSEVISYDHLTTFKLTLEGKGKRKVRRERRGGRPGFFFFHF